MNSLLLVLVTSAIPVLLGLGFTGVFALLGVWQRANAAAQASAFQLASAKLESGVEAALHAFQGQVSPLAVQFSTKQLSATAFASSVLSALKKDGQQYLLPSVADALGTTLSGLETMALAMAAKKVGLSPTAVPYVQAGPGVPGNPR